MKKGDRVYLCERICSTYIETGRTIRSLAGVYGYSKSTIGNYINKYAAELVSHDLFKQVKRRAKQNMQEVYSLGQSENRYSDQLGSLD